MICDLKATNKSETLPPFGQCRMLCIIAHSSIRVASGIILLTDTSTSNPFFKSAFDVEYLTSPVSLNKYVGIGAIAHIKINHLF